MLPRAAVAFLLVLAACTSAPEPATSVPGSVADAVVDSVDDSFVPPELPSAGTPIAATVTRVHDGDSMDVTIDGQPDEVRLLGINAPEGDECLGDAARAAMIEAVAGKEVMLFGAERDQFGRLLALMEVGGSPVGWLAVRRGLAFALTVDHPRLGAYGQAEDDAFVDGLGIWALDACGPQRPEIVGITKVEWDPPGRDSDNLNGEFVRLETEGEPFDLGGWVLRDESTRWRFEFPRGFMLGGDVTVYTGCGEGDTDELYWCATDPLWNNFGDTAMLLDDSGNVVARVSYGPKAER
ncbi:MAG: lamin tail domain-containing protein [Acidimicrobiia bacterium]